MLLDSVGRVDEIISPTMVSNLFTMGASATVDARQEIPERPTIPNVDVRVLRARLVIEEALELLFAMGISISVRYPEQLKSEPISKLDDLLFLSDGKSAFQLDLDEIVDGACDLIYVAVGTLASCGIPDGPHMAEVCARNDAKFPQGKPIINTETGKFLKPEGWTSPNHDSIFSQQTVNLKTASDEIVHQ